MKTLILLFLPFLINAQQSHDPQNIIDQAIRKHGGKNYAKKTFQFDFRDKTYTYQNRKGQYTYMRSFISEEGTIKDILTNKGFLRTINGNEVSLDPVKSKAYSNSVNSVIYFAMIPHFLNDDAVHKEYIGTKDIQGHVYYKIRVTFKEDGGGQDHDDIYVYWIHTKDYTVDYLAYSYHVNGGGVRFRSAYNNREVAGVRFQDYINYKHDSTTPVEEMDEYYLKGELQELSKIELRNIISL